MSHHSETMLRLARYAFLALSTEALEQAQMHPHFLNSEDGARCTLLFAQVLQRSEQDHARPSAAASDLAPIRLTHLRSGVAAASRVLHGVLITDPLKINASCLALVITELQDPDGKKVLLMIKNAVASDAGDRQVRAKFPRGARVAVKEPTLQDTAGVKFISLENPASLEILSFLSQAEVVRLRGLSPLEVREAGNVMYKGGGYGAAAEVYELSARRAREEELVQDEVLALSNRAECMLKMKRLEYCVDVVDAALNLDPAHVKSLHRKAMALLGLRLYDWACDVLRHHLGVDQQLDALFERATKLAMQSHDSGKCVEEMSKFLEDWAGKPKQASVKFPELAEYIGPVEVRMCSDQRYGRGRGLFAVENIKKGELVMVTNALNMEKGETEDLCNQNALVRILNMATSSRRAYQQISSLVNKVAGRDREIPDMNLFRPNWITPENWSSRNVNNDRELLQGISVEKISSTVRKASFNPTLHHTVGTSSSSPKKKLYVGTYLLPSFINHSCSANVTRTMLGEAVWFMASRDIAAGEEIGWCYICPSHPYRRKRLQGMRMRCECIKCEVEQRLDKDLEQVTSCYRDLEGANFLPRIKGETDVPAMLVKLENLLKWRLEREDERQCLRCVHWMLYMVYHQNLGNPVYEMEKLADGVLPPMEVVMAAMLKFSPGNNFVFFRGMVEYAVDKVAAEKVLREEWECKLGKLSDGVYRAVSDRFLELSRLLSEAFFCLPASAVSAALSSAV